MRHQKLLIFFILLVSTFIIRCKKESDTLPSDVVILGNVLKPEIIDEYIYPVQPGTPEWAALRSHDEMLAVLQLPESVLQNISTWGLAQTCFKYPLYADYAAQNNQATYINSLAKSFNGLKELFAREDAPLVLLYEYRHLDFTKYSNPFKINFIELILGNDSLIKRFNKRQLVYLVTVALEQVKEHREYFDSSMAPNSLYIMANVMTYAKYKPFIDYCKSTNDGFLGEFVLWWGIGTHYEKIEDYAKEFVKDQSTN